MLPRYLLLRALCQLLQTPKSSSHLQLLLPQAKVRGQRNRCNADLVIFPCLTYVGAHINHDEEVQDEHEYSDTDLGAVEEHKSIILHLLSQLKLGMDLTKVVLPTFILEKRSLLEMFADCMAHPDIFLK